MSNFISQLPTIFLLLLPFISLGLVLLFKKDRKFYLFSDSIIQLILIILFIVVISFSDKMVAEFGDVGWAFVVALTAAYIFLYQQFTNICNLIWLKVNKNPKEDFRPDKPTILFILCFAAAYIFRMSNSSILLSVFVVYLAIKRIVNFVRKK